MLIMQASYDRIVDNLKAKAYSKESFYVAEHCLVADFAFVDNQLYVRSGIGLNKGWDPVAYQPTNTRPKPMAPSGQSDFSAQISVFQNTVQAPATPPPPYTPGAYWSDLLPAQTLRDRAAGVDGSHAQEIAPYGVHEQRPGGQTIIAPFAVKEAGRHSKHSDRDPATGRFVTSVTPSVKIRRPATQRYKDAVTGRDVSPNAPGAIKAVNYSKRTLVDPRTNRPVDANFPNATPRGVLHSRRAAAKKKALALEKLQAKR